MWKKFVAVGCSHGSFLDKGSARQFIAFCHRYKPHLVVHLGDAIDLSPLRGKGRASEEDSSSLRRDFEEGFDFLQQFLVTGKERKYFLGNHEDRCWQLLSHPNAIIGDYAGMATSHIEKFAKQSRAELIPYDISSGWRRVGDYLFGHGYMAGQSAIRDHAETFGNCVIAHLHTTGMARGRRGDQPKAYCTGTLASIPMLSYAKAQRGRLQWGQGWAFGEYRDDKETIVWLAERSKDGTFRLPI